MSRKQPASRTPTATTPHTAAPGTAQRPGTPKISEHQRQIHLFCAQVAAMQCSERGGCTRACRRTRRCVQAQMYRRKAEEIAAALALHGPNVPEPPSAAARTAPPDPTPKARCKRQAGTQPARPPEHPLVKAMREYMTHRQLAEDRRTAAAAPAQGVPPPSKSAAARR